MDKATVGGLALGTALLVISIVLAPGASFGGFIDIPSALVVLGGAVAASLIAFPLSAILALPKVIRKTVQPRQNTLKPIIGKLIELSEIARRDGILALEDRLDSIEDPFMLSGIQMAVDGIDTETTQRILQSEIEALKLRHKNGKSLLEALGRYAPAFGMIGTLMGLIIMLGNMDDPESIGPGMAVALITTLYGAVAANLVFLPLADKLGFYGKQELEVREVILRGIMSIQEGDNPRVVEQKLMTFLPATERAEKDESAKLAA